MGWHLLKHGIPAHVLVQWGDNLRLAKVSEFCDAKKHGTYVGKVLGKMSRLHKPGKLPRQHQACIQRKTPGEVNLETECLFWDDNSALNHFIRDGIHVFAVLAYKFQWVGIVCWLNYWYSHATYWVCAIRIKAWRNPPKVYIGEGYYLVEREGSRQSLP